MSTGTTEVQPQEIPPPPPQKNNLKTIVTALVIVILAVVGGAVYLQSHHAFPSFTSAPKSAPSSAPATNPAPLQPTQTAAPATQRAAPVAAAPTCSDDPNNPLPACTYTPHPQQASSLFSTVQTYVGYINGGNYSAGWAMLSPSVQGGWNGNYATYVANFGPLSFSNVYEVSESSDTVTYAYTLYNGNTGMTRSGETTFTVDNGIITSST